MDLLEQLGRDNQLLEDIRALIGLASDVKWRASPESLGQLSERVRAQAVAAFGSGSRRAELYGKERPDLVSLNTEGDLVTFGDLEDARGVVAVDGGIPRKAIGAHGIDGHVVVQQQLSVRERDVLALPVHR